MRQEIRENPLIVLRTHSAPTSVSFLQVLRAVPRVVFATVRGHTRKTSRAARSDLLVLERKHREEFDEATRPAPLFAQNSGWHEIGLHETSRSRWYGCARRFSTSGAPVELKCSPATMAARAAHITLLDLSGYADPCLVRGQDHHAKFLRRRVTVIKVKNNDVRLSAVDAWVRPKKFADKWPVLFAISPDPFDLLADIPFAVADVMLPAVLRVTGTTTPLSRGFDLVCERERIYRLRESAVVAPLCCRLDRRERRRERHEGPLRSGSAPRSA